MYDFASLTERVKNHLADYDAGHDWLHIERVVNNSLKIGVAEDADLSLTKAIALTHDIADHKFYSGNGLELVRATVVGLVPVEALSKIFEAWNNMSYSKGRTPISLEGKIVQDADRLDAMGAIGVLRAASYSGYVNRPLVNPRNFEDENTAVGHFYEKLLKLKAGMNTVEGKRLAEQRHSFMLEFIGQLKSEI